jgi:hypothetical protein
LATVALIRGRYPRDELLALSSVAVLTLLVTYHRYYDAVLLVLPLVWGFSAIGSARRVQAVTVVLLCAVFILPVPSNLFDLQQAGALPAWVVQHPLWESFVLTHQVWALILMALTLLWAAARIRLEQRRSSSGSGGMPGWWSWQDGAHDEASA